MSRYAVKIEAEVSCNSDAEARAAAEALRQLLANPLAKAALISRGVKLLVAPRVTFEKK